MLTIATAQWRAWCARLGSPTSSASGSSTGRPLRAVERPQLAQLATCPYIQRAEDVVIAGPIGTGKTHLAIARESMEAARRRHRVAFERRGRPRAAIWSRRATS